MNWYRCDVCGQPIQLDPNDERVCTVCQETMEEASRCHKVARRYAGILRLEDSQKEMEEIMI